jgi:hypothetical protein
MNTQWEQMIRAPAHHLLILELFGDISGSTSRNFNPSLAEESTSGKHEEDVDGGMNWVDNGFTDGVRRGHVIRNTRGCNQLDRVLHRL